MRRGPEDENEEDLALEPDDPDAWRDYCDDPYGDEVAAEINEERLIE